MTKKIQRKCQTLTKTRLQVAETSTTLTTNYSRCSGAAIGKHVSVDCREQHHHFVEMKMELRSKLQVRA